MKSSALLALGAAIAPALAGKGNLPPVTTRGNAFFADGERFYVRGVAYQPGGAADAQDPLLDMPSLRRDVANFKELGINTIRIYTIDNSQNHDEAMKLLDDAGIYLALDANSPEYSLNRQNADTLHASYNEVYIQNVFAIIDAFADYNNLLLFFSGNEVINERNNTNAAPYIKAITRDMKQYISNHKDRIIPVGYSAADVAENIEQQAFYFNCGSDDERSDFFALNDYSWCDPSSFTISGWDQKVELYGNYSIPLFLSEYGCIQDDKDRLWGEVASLYHTNMTSVYSGGLAYEYTVEPNGYGIVEVVNGEITPNEDFDRLQTSFARTSNPTGDGGYKQNGSPSECPSESEEWDVKGTGLPAMPVNAQKYMDDGAGRGVGLDGSGSHFAGTPSESEADSGSGSPSRTPSSDSNNSGGNTTGGAINTEIPLHFMGIIAASVVFGVVLVL